jgi:hypothetical protein
VYPSTTSSVLNSIAPLLLSGQREVLGCDLLGDVGLVCAHRPRTVYGCVNRRLLGGRRAVSLARGIHCHGGELGRDVAQVCRSTHFAVKMMYCAAMR